MTARRSWRQEEAVLDRYAGRRHSDDSIVAVMVSIAECFAKTWFVALVMAMGNDKTVVFAGSFLALLLHVGIAADLGLAIS